MSIVKSDNDDDLNSSSSSNDDDVTFTFQESLSELSELVGTAGLEVKGIMVQKLQNVNSRVILLFSFQSSSLSLSSSSSFLSLSLYCRHM
jgi:hypothetical protein